MARKIDLKDCTLTIKDDGSEEVEIKFADGNFRWSDAETFEYDLDRHLLLWPSRLSSIFPNLEMIFNDLGQTFRLKHAIISDNLYIPRHFLTK